MNNRYVPNKKRSPNYARTFITHYGSKIINTNMNAHCNGEDFERRTPGRGEVAKRRNRQVKTLCTS